MGEDTLRMALAAAFSAALLLAAGPTPAHESLAIFHYESEGRCSDCAGDPHYHWDFYTGSGSIRQASILTGTVNNVSRCHQMEVNGTVVDASSYTARADDRGFSTDEVNVGGVRVTREVYVPETGMDFARFVDSIRNPGGGDTDVTVRYLCTVQGCGGWLGGADCDSETSDGDSTLEPTRDNWYAFQSGSSAAVGLLFYAEGADEILTAASDGGGFGNYQFTFELTVPGGETLRLLTFVAQGNDEVDLGAILSFLSLLPDEAAADWDDGLPDFANFITDGRPGILARGPYQVAEGGEIVLEVTVFDREGDPLTWEWELSGDDPPLFDDSTDVRPLFSAADIDGDEDFPIWLRVSDGENVVSQEIEVEILNVPPTILSEPPTTARRGGEYRYTPVVVDPGPDTYTLELVGDEGDDYPTGMIIEGVPGEQSIVWVPDESQVAPFHPVHMVAEDDDGDEFAQEWEISVEDNAAPYAPNMLYPTQDECVRVPRPTLKVGNATDADEDPLSYHFQVDPDSGFRSIDLQKSPEDGIPEGANGFTEWQVPNSLQDGRLYYWRAWVSDGIDGSEPLTQVFEVCLDGDGGDADVDGDGDGDGDGDDTGAAAGCACRTAGHASAPAGALGLILALGFLRRRRS